MPTGQTKDAGWQMGARKTVEKNVEEVWDFLFSVNGLKTWLNTDRFEEKESARTLDGTTYRVRVFKPCSHLRMAWKKPEWKNESTLQLRVLDAGKKTTIAFHQEKLLDQKQREKCWNIGKKFWKLYRIHSITKMH